MIKIKKAIEITEGLLKTGDIGDQDITNSIALGKEALKRFQSFREGNRVSLIEPLPGEDLKDYGKL